MSFIVDALDAKIQWLANLADDTGIPYRTLTLYLGAVQTYFELLVDRRQLTTTERTTPPAELKAHLNNETFTKAQAYARDKLYYHFLYTLYGWGVGFAFIRYNTYAWAWDKTGQWMDQLEWSQSRVITHSLLWIVLISSIPLVPGLLWNYYYTFVLEQKHGFNKTTIKTWITDNIKQNLLAAVIGLPFLAGFLRIIEWAGKNFVPWLMLFLISVQLTLQIIYPILIQPLFNKFTPVPDGEIRTRVEKLASDLKFPLKHLYVIDGSKRSSHSNAYFYGLPWSKQIVLYDTLIEKSTPAEVEAVLAHELGHWYFAHPSRLLLVTQAHLLFTLVIFSVFIHNKALFEAFGFDPRLAVQGPAGGPQPIIIGFMLYQLLFEPLDTFVKFGLNAMTRAYEYQADEFAVRLGHKKELGNALIKLHIDNLSSPHADWLYSMYHHSHPTLPERLRHMDEYKGGDWLAKKPDAQTPEAKVAAEGKKDL